MSTSFNFEWHPYYWRLEPLTPNLHPYAPPPLRCLSSKAFPNTLSLATSHLQVSQVGRALVKVLYPPGQPCSNTLRFPNHESRAHYKFIYEDRARRILTVYNAPRLFPTDMSALYVYFFYRADPEESFTPVRLNVSLC